MCVLAEARWPPFSTGILLTFRINTKSGGEEVGEH